MNDKIIRVAADGSPGSRRALEWALSEAQIRNCAVELVSVHRPDHPASSAEAAVHATMDDIIAGRADLPTISWHVVAGEPAEVLAHESEHSELLVLGSHGLSGLRHSALGSVADLCARLSHCPVVILPPMGDTSHAHDDLSLLKGTATPHQGDN